MWIGQRFSQNRPSSWLIEHGASAGFYHGIVVDFDDLNVVIATDGPGDFGREVTIPRHLFATIIPRTA